MLSGHQWSPNLEILISLLAEGVEYAYRCTNQELKLALIFAEGTPSCTDISILLLKGLEHELKRLFPVVNTTSDWENESFGNGHCEILVIEIDIVPDNKRESKKLLIKNLIENEEKLMMRYTLKGLQSLFIPSGRSCPPSNPGHSSHRSIHLGS